MKLVMIQPFGNGDLFESRQFALDWMWACGVTTAKYAHKPKYYGSFEDLPQIESVPITQAMMTQAAGGIAWNNDELMVNMWIGRGWAPPNHKGYVLDPGVGCVLEMIYQMHNDLRVEAGLPLISKSMVEMIPTIDYTRIFIANTLKEYLAQNIGRKLVLVCNGKTTSAQADNFDYHVMLDYLPQHDGVRYLLTEKVTIPDRPDVVFTDDLTQRNKIQSHPGWDMTAISYLSRYCDVMVGRCSGTHMYTQVLENWMDSSKTLVCFTHHRNGACFVRNPESLGLKMRVLWSPATNARDAADVLNDVLSLPKRTNGHSVSKQKLFMAVARFKEPHNPRKEIAQRSWNNLVTQGVNLCEMWDYPRTSKVIGDPRALPFLKDLLSTAMKQAGDDDVISYVNDDIYVHPNLPEELIAHVSKHGPVCSQRCEFIRRPFPSDGSPPSIFASQGGHHPGRDLFAFPKRWLVEHWDEIGDAVLGASEVDYMLAILVRLHYGIKTDTKNIFDCIFPAELPRGFIAHQYHIPVWSSKAVVNNAPSQKHNRELLRLLATKHSLDIKFGKLGEPIYKP